MPDPRAWLTERLGPLAWCEVEPPPVAPAPHRVVVGGTAVEVTEAAAAEADDAGPPPPPSRSVHLPEPPAAVPSGPITTPEPAPEPAEEGILTALGLVPIAARPACPLDALHPLRPGAGPDVALADPDDDCDSFIDPGYDPSEGPDPDPPPPSIAVLGERIPWDFEPGRPARHRPFVTNSQYFTVSTRSGGPSRPRR